MRSMHVHIDKPIDTIQYTPRLDNTIFLEKPHDETYVLDGFNGTTWMLLCGSAYQSRCHQQCEGHVNVQSHATARSFDALRAFF